MFPVSQSPSPAVVMALPTVAPPMVFRAKLIRWSRREAFSRPAPGRDSRSGRLDFEAADRKRKAMHPCVGLLAWPLVYLIFISVRLSISVLSLFGHPQSKHRCFHICRPQGVAETAPQHGASCQGRPLALHVWWNTSLQREKEDSTDSADNEDNNLIQIIK